MMKSAFELDDLDRFEQMRCGEYCEIANEICFVHSGYHANRKRTSRIVTKNVSNGEERFFTCGGKRESEPRFSPDGKTLAMISDGCVCVISLDQGTITKLTKPIGAHTISWSPMGDRLLFCSEEESLEAGLSSGETIRDNAVAITDFGYKFDGAGFVSMRHTHIWTVDLNENMVRLTDGDWDDLFPTFTPDGALIVFISGRARSKQESIGADLFTVPAGGGEIKRISSLGAIVSYPIPFQPLVTPDGKSVVAAYLPGDASDPRHEKGMPPSRLLRVNLDGSDERDIFNDSGAAYECVAFPYNVSGARCYERAQLSSDGKHVIFLCGNNGRTSIFKASLYGESKVTLLFGEEGSFMGIGKPQGGLLLVAFGDAKAPCEYCLIDEATGKQVSQITHTNAFLQEREVGIAREVWLDTLDGEGRIQGWVLPPANMEEGRKYPAVLYIHGGPHPYYTPCFDFEFQCLAAAGFAVLFCNPRGSSGYGKAHLAAGNAFNGNAYTDLLQFVDVACRSFDFIDPARIGATGGSYGGYMVNYMATHSKRFCCFVTQRSIANELISYASSDMQGDSSEYESFLDFMKAQLEKSAVIGVQNVSAPILILHGIEDLRCPVAEAHQFFTALLDTHSDLPVRMILFPHVGHGQPERLEQLTQYREAMIEWFTRYL
ncbi:MAG: S9 family peptidase [Eubacteriales bacterium]|nr:S9 family peptidase [Eubacteriales bacterium]